MVDKIKNSTTGKTATIAICLVTMLFFVWGLTMNLVNGLNNPMGKFLNLSSTETSLLQLAYFGAYFVMAIPASIIAKKFGYKAGVITGLSLFVAGALITIPATKVTSYAIFLIAMFVLACGAATLETNCNPYITKLGDEKRESFRLNLAQSFNGIGSLVAPAIIGAVAQPNLSSVQFFANMRLVYIVIAIVLAAILVVFIIFKLPTPPGDEIEENTKNGSMLLQLKKPYVALGVLCGFLFIGVQVIGQSQIANFSAEILGADTTTAANYLFALSFTFMLGRFISTPLMAKFKPGNILAVYMIVSIVLFFVGFLSIAPISVYAIIAAYLFVSIGFPTVFSLALNGLQGAAVKSVSSMMIMAIVGAALIPMLSSSITDALGSIKYCWLVCIPLLAYVAWYGAVGCKIGLKKENK